MVWGLRFRVSELLSLWCRANLGRGLRTLSWFSVGTIAGAWSVGRICKSDDPGFSVADGAGAWSVRQILLAIDDPLVLFGR